MKLKLTLSKPEYQALATITGNLINILDDESDFLDFCFKAALEELALRLLPTLHNGAAKKKNRIQLTDMQTVAFWYMLNSYCGHFQPYEYALGCSIIAQADLQYKKEAALRRAVQDIKNQQKQIQ